MSGAYANAFARAQLDLARYRYVYATIGGDAVGAYRGNRDAALRDARRLCRKSDAPVLFYEDGSLTGRLTPAGGRAMWTSAAEEAA